MSTFSSFQLDARLTPAIRELGWAEPTPIQARALPVALAGRDLIGVAQTGTGKTAAFALPILDRLIAGPRGRVRALVLAPTRELAEQIHQAIGELGRRAGLRSVAIYGGVPMNPQIRNLRGADVVVACPGRLLDHMEQRTIDLRAIEILVLDEADRMLDMGFLPPIRRIVRALPAKRQTLLFSATMPSDVRTLTRELQRDPVAIEIGRPKPAATVAHAIYPVEPHLKTALLRDLLKRIDGESFLVFTRTKRRADRLAKQLGGPREGVASLHGDLSQGQRQRAIDGFRGRAIRVLVATDIAARGIDVTSISHVINYDMPDTLDAYTHRSGRTGRAERNGDAFTFTTREDDATVREIERALGTKLERRRLEGFDYEVPPPAPERIG
ncbi:MAG: DEAD/DEAH box helicase, partial [Candidatus Binatia bacterium]